MKRQRLCKQADSMGCGGYLRRCKCYAMLCYAQTFLLGGQRIRCFLSVELGNGVDVDVDVAKCACCYLDGRCANVLLLRRAILLIRAVAVRTGFSRRNWPTNGQVVDRHDFSTASLLASIEPSSHLGYIGTHMVKLCVVLLRTGLPRTQADVVSRKVCSPSPGRMPFNGPFRKGIRHHDPCQDRQIGTGNVAFLHLRSRHGHHGHHPYLRHPSADQTSA
jgi:hypothetical protein